MSSQNDSVTRLRRLILLAGAATLASLPSQVKWAMKNRAAELPGRVLLSAIAAGFGIWVLVSLLTRLQRFKEKRDDVYLVVLVASFGCLFEIFPSAPFKFFFGLSWLAFLVVAISMLLGVGGQKPSIRCLVAMAKRLLLPPLKIAVEVSPDRRKARISLVADDFAALSSAAIHESATLLLHALPHDEHLDELTVDFSLVRCLDPRIEMLIATVDAYKRLYPRKSVRVVGAEINSL